MQGRPITEEEIVKYIDLYLVALKTNHGLETQTDTYLTKKYPKIKIGWKNFRIKHKKIHRTFADDIRYVQEDVTESVENEMFDSIFVDKSQPMIKFYLERKAKYRLETKSLVENLEPIQINIIKPEDTE